MVCELLGAVECLAICVINMASSHLGVSDVAVTLWAAGLAGLVLSIKKSR